MKLVVGLGNPGVNYLGTRHNIGYSVVDYLASAPGVSSWRSKFESELTEMKEGAEQILLLKPMTFMNLSGRAVNAVMGFYKLVPSDLLVICDDIALPLGKLRMKAAGSHGGQNGLRNIQDQLATSEYPRLRIGVGDPGEHMDAAAYVLGRFKPGERPAAGEAIALAARAVVMWVRQGIDVCMNQVNGEPKPEKPKRDKPMKEKPPVDMPSTEPRTSNPED